MTPAVHAIVRYGVIDRAEIMRQRPIVARGVFSGDFKEFTAAVAARGRAVPLEMSSDDALPGAPGHDPPYLPVCGI
jgi:hypothetical protein